MELTRDGGDDSVASSCWQDPLTLRHEPPLPSPSLPMLRATPLFLTPSPFPHRHTSSSGDNSRQWRDDDGRESRPSSSSPSDIFPILACFSPSQSLPTLPSVIPVGEWSDTISLIGPRTSLMLEPLLANPYEPAASSSTADHRFAPLSSGTMWIWAHRSNRH